MFSPPRVSACAAGIGGAKIEEIQEGRIRRLDRYWQTLDWPTLGLTNLRSNHYTCSRRLSGLTSYAPTRAPGYEAKNDVQQD
jgi:hypothetical protein